MPTPPSGPISINDIAGVFDGPQNLAAYYGQLAFREGDVYYLPGSGPLGMDLFYNLYYRLMRGVITVGSSGVIRGYQSGVTGSWVTNEGIYSLSALYYSTSTNRTTVVFTTPPGGAPPSSAMLQPAPARWCSTPATAPTMKCPSR